MKSIMPIASAAITVEGKEDEASGCSLDASLTLHERLGGIECLIVDRPRFDSADAASIVLALLTLLVSIASLVKRGG